MVAMLDAYSQCRTHNHDIAVSSRCESDGFCNIACVKIDEGKGKCEVVVSRQSSVPIPKLA
jgi:hypothetical protein